MYCRDRIPCRLADRKCESGEFIEAAGRSGALSIQSTPDRTSGCSGAESHFRQIAGTQIGGFQWKKLMALFDNMSDNTHR